VKRRLWRLSCGGEGWLRRGGCVFDLGVVAVRGDMVGYFDLFVDGGSGCCLLSCATILVRDVRPTYVYTSAFPAMLLLEQCFLRVTVPLLHFHMTIPQLSRGRPGTETRDITSLLTTSLCNHNTTAGHASQPMKSTPRVQKPTPKLIA